MPLPFFTFFCGFRSRKSPRRSSTRRPKPKVRPSPPSCCADIRGGLLPWLLESALSSAQQVFRFCRYNSSRSGGGSNHKAPQRAQEAFEDGGVDAAAGFSSNGETLYSPSFHRRGRASVSNLTGVLLSCQALGDPDEDKESDHLIIKRKLRSKTGRK